MSAGAVTASAANVINPTSVGCSNTEFRVGFSAFLPDCRAYELVSPPNVEPYFENAGSPGNLIGEGSKPLGQAWGVQAAVAGDRISFFSPYGLAGSASDGSYFLTTREADGWSTENMVPPQSVTNSGVGCFNAYFALLRPDLSGGVLADGFGQGEQPGNLQINCATDDPVLVAGEPEGFQNLFSRNGHDPYELINLTPAGVSPHDAWAQAGSEDLSRVVFDEEAELTPDAPPGDDLYEWVGGALRLVTYLPDGTPVQGTLANADLPHVVSGPGSGPGAETFTRSVSSDGSRVYFTFGGNLYVRENAELAPHEAECTSPSRACTVQVDASLTGGAGGGGKFQWASADGQRVFFTDENALTEDSTAVPGKPDLYEFDLAAGEAGTLRDLTVDGGEPAGVLGVTGVSEDGSYAYFVAEGDLSGARTNSEGAEAQPGKPNLYLRHAGATTFIATLDEADTADWALPNWTTARVSPSGGFVAFDSVGRPTGYDNSDAVTEQPDQEIFLYDAAKSLLACASCDPSGARPTAPARIGPPIRDPLNEQTPGHLQRNLSELGQVYFNTVDGLLPSDTNGVSDVYEYEEGKLQLISTGAIGAISYFSEASVDGSDVFFLTSGMSGDSREGINIFDARVGGGFPPAPPSPPVCGAANCTPPVAPPPTLSAPGSSIFTGPGNLAPPKPVVVKPKTAAQIKAEKLRKALKVCRSKRNRHKRRACESQARKRYGSAPKIKKHGKKNPTPVRGKAK